MIRRKAVGFALVLACAGAAAGGTRGAAQETDAWAQGSWKGLLVAGPQRLELIYHLTRGEDGTWTGTMDVPAQGATGIPLTTVEVSDTGVVLTFPVPGGGRYEGVRSEEGDSISGTFTQAGQSFPLRLGRMAAGDPARTPRPQEPVGPVPYRVEEVTFTNDADGIELAGTLTLPPGEGPFPGVVLVTGSGPQDRDESLMGHKPFLVLADFLTRRGIAVLRYDDRGVGGSSGSLADATSEDLAEDALAAVRYLAARPEVADDRVGIVGHSEGGLVGPMAATRSDAVAFVVMLAGPGVPGAEIIRAQSRLISRASGMPEEIIAMNDRIQSRFPELAEMAADTLEGRKAFRALVEAEMASLPDSLQTQVEAELTDESVSRTLRQLASPWFRYFLTYDPRPALEALDVPVLALLGEKDLQVSPDQNAPEIEAALRRGGNPDATVLILPGLNHLFQHAETGAPSEYGEIEETFAPEAMELVADWILERFGDNRQERDSHMDESR